MAVFIESKAYAVDVVMKKAASGKEFATCKLVFYSKSKDKNGAYTEEDPKFQCNVCAFGRNAEYLKSLPDGKGLVSVMGKLSNEKLEKNGHSVYLNRLDIMKISDVQEGARAEELTEEDIPF